MRANNPDVVVVGAGIAGASIAAVLARGGVEVLLLERQREYRDRVRGEYMAPWGVLEARALGLEDVIRSTQAVDARYSVPYDELFAQSAAEEAKSDRSTIFPDVRGPLCACHPKTCQALAKDAVRSGAELVWGVAEVRVQTGKRPSISFRNGTEREVRPRLIIGADGRASTVRKQSSIHINKTPATHVVAGLLVEGASRWPANQYAIGVEGDLQFYVFPQGGGRVRLYTCHANEQATRWAGRAGAQRFVRAFAGLRSIPESLGLGDVTPAGPCATFSGEQTWCDEPYADGVDDNLYRRRSRSTRSILCSLQRWPRGRSNGPGRDLSWPGPPAQRGVHGPAPRIAAGLTMAGRASRCAGAGRRPAGQRSGCRRTRS
jgi:menaquinone-9 beta-reductase